jgi:hypothetical protein
VDKERILQTGGKKAREMKGHQMLLDFQKSHAIKM